MNDIYLALMIKYYSPRHYMIRAHRLLGRLARRMIQNGYTDAQIIALANKARYHHGLSELSK